MKNSFFFSFILVYNLDYYLTIKKKKIKNYICKIFIFLDLGLKKYFPLFCVHKLNPFLFVGSDFSFIMNTVLLIYIFKT